MDDVPVELSEATYREVQRLADEQNTDIVKIIEQAVNELSQRLFWDQANAAYAALRADPVAWAEELQERAAWDVTLMDGLHDDPYP